MNNFLKSLMENAGTTKVPFYARQSMGCRAIVNYSSEFKRIENIPRRDGRTRQGEVIILTEELSPASGRMVLWPIQASALRDICLYRGGFFPIGVGLGKALVSLLAGTVLEVSRPVLFVPAELREQTNQHVLPEMLRHWKIPNNLRVIGYSELSLAKNSRLLEELNPDLIILDECHYLKNVSAGRTRRMVRWFRDHPETLCIAMSGTVCHKTIKDFAHISAWCLKGNNPLPSKWPELSEWADAIDENVPDENRVDPGALNRFCEEGENVRQGFRRRLTETPGVVASKESDLGVSLIIKNYALDTPNNVRSAMTDLETTWVTPNGDMLSEAVELWRHLRELSLGFYYRWDPVAPRDWLEARREWKAYVREEIKYSRGKYDTELQVWNECSRGYKKSREFIAWEKIKKAFVINSIAEWISDFALNACAEWLNDGGICWVEHTAFGKKLAKDFKLAYFGAGDSKILNTKEKSIIASIQSHGTGKNLQQFDRNLITSPMSSGKTFEQVLGRTHRPGQTSDVVTVDLMLHAEVLKLSFEQARKNSRYLEDTLGNRQKLNYATVLV